ncbi:type II toxin-antitoxin system Phd/YefM family antitoxin [Candidatus Tisiphia endosymbiont of Nemotelus uliginosus]|uniref:type II toxin-antitoxin system Phd/YefM family antitoxin n=1 Tax=Candidatus Tisiphia endosymbiont of Nemotelus uliginosus TaxID=3077926 RepID=UPI0035C935DE
MMEAISYTQARNKLASLMDKVCTNHHSLIITRQKQKSVVIMSLDDYNALEETCYLLRSPKNAERLNRAINDLKENINFKNTTIDESIIS